MSHLDALLRVAGCTGRECRIIEDRIDGASTLCIAAAMGRTEGQVRAWLHRAVVTAANIDSRIYDEVLLPAAGEMVGCLHGDAGGSAPELADLRGNRVKLRVSPAQCDLADRWQQWLFEGGIFQ